MKLNDNEINEHDALLKIVEGTKLDEFDMNTLLMRFAAVVHHEDGHKEIPADKWTRLLASYAVKKNFEALECIPNDYRISCTNEFSKHANTLTRETKDEWAEILNKQDVQFIKKALRERPSIARYLNEDNQFVGKDALINSAIKKAFVGKEEDDNPKHITIPEMNYEIYLDDMDEAQSASGYFNLPVEKRTREALMELVESDSLFPGNFIKRLIQPLRNEYLFTKSNETEKAERAKKEVLSFVNQEFCIMVAEKHPEASVVTPSFLKEDAVKSFMRKLKEDSKTDMIKHYFVSFPAKMLDLEMIEGIPVNFQMLNHAPDILADTEMANRFLNRYPFRVLDLPEQYQHVNRIMKETVELTRRSIRKIKNETLRQNVAIAIGLEPIRTKNDRL